MATKWEFALRILQSTDKKSQYGVIILLIDTYTEIYVNTEKDMSRFDRRHPKNVSEKKSYLFRVLRDGDEFTKQIRNNYFQHLRKSVYIAGKTM